MQAIILGTPENLGYMSGALKDFFDRCYYPLLEKTEGLPYALFIRAGSDGTGTRRAVESIATGLRWRKAREPLICRGPWREEFVDEARELGALMAASLDAASGRQLWETYLVPRSRDTLPAGVADRMQAVAVGTRHPQHLQPRGLGLSPCRCHHLESLQLPDRFADRQYQYGQ